MTATPELFGKYLNDYFVETGTWRGTGCIYALTAGFKFVRSIELSKELYEFSLRRLSRFPNVKLYWGDSSEMLWEMIRDIDQPITFWLDAHFSHGDTVRGKANTSLLAELEVISRHPVKTHTILIDDRKEFGTVNFDFIREGEAIEALRRINSDYEILVETGDPIFNLFVDDILAATPRKKTRSDGGSGEDLELKETRR